MTRRDFTPTRRTLLGGALAGAGLAGLPVGATASAAGFDPTSWESVRDQFALNRRHRQFTAYYLAAHPAPVADAIARHRRALDRDTAVYISDWDTRDAAVRKAGPRGTGVVWGRKAAWAYVDPTIPSFCLPALLGWWNRHPRTVTTVAGVSQILRRYACRTSSWATTRRGSSASSATAPRRDG